MKPKNIKRIQSRSRDLKARVINAHLVIVGSTTTATANHVVTVDYESDGKIHARCTCEWAIRGGIGCSHTLAALEALAAKRGRILSFWANRDQARRQKRRLFQLVGQRDPDDGIWITSRAA